MYTAYAVGDGEMPDTVDGIDGVVISGSPSSFNDDDPWIPEILESIRHLDDRRVPTLGICFVS